jgi:hypothetical protein
MLAILVLVLLFVTAILSAVYLPSAGGLQMLSRQLLGRYGQITGQTAATGSAAVLTSNNHGLVNGSCITIQGATGDTAINNTGGNPIWVVYNVTTNAFSIAAISGGASPVLTPVLNNGTWGAVPAGCYWTLAPVENGILKLYQSITTPSEGDTAITYTELSGAPPNGYSSQPLYSLVQILNPTPPPTALQVGWTIPATVGGGGTGGWAHLLGTAPYSTNVPESTHNAISWTFGPGAINSVYGYFVVGQTTGIIWWAEEFNNPPKNFSPGDTLQITPRIGLTHT